MEREKITSDYRADLRRSLGEYRQLLQNYLNKFLEDNPQLKSPLAYMRDFPFPTDLVEKLMLKEQCANLKQNMYETLSSREEFKWALDWQHSFFDRDNVANNFADYIKTNFSSEFQEYKDRYFEDWQFQWSSSLAQNQLQTKDWDVRTFGKKAVFLIGSFLSTFELFYQLFLEPFAASQGFEGQISYSESREAFQDSLKEQGADPKAITFLNELFDKALDYQLRNSLAKHDYFFPRDEESIVYFRPDALAKGGFKERDKISMQEFLEKLFILQALFWTAVVLWISKNLQLESILQPIHVSYPSLRTLCERAIGSAELIQLIEQQINKSDLGIEGYLKTNGPTQGWNILPYQLLESWLRFRVILLTYFRHEWIPDFDTIKKFTRIEEHLLREALFKDLYLMRYEQMMQSVVQPTGKLLSGFKSKGGALKTLRELKRKGK